MQLHLWDIFEFWEADDEKPNELISTNGKTHQLILSLLSAMEWVVGKEILHKTNQSNYDRRIRELREEGWDIEVGRIGRDSRYRLKTFEKREGHKREYIGEQLRIEILQRDNYICQLCRIEVIYGLNAQVDHKIPVARRGNSKQNNLQTVCYECNLIKRRICQVCINENCKTCVYAFPENLKI